MKITDSGKGFNMDEVSFGRGLNELRKRASNLKADINIDTEYNTGTTIFLQMVM